MKPVLSICIPTLNRAPLLQVLLENLQRETSACLDRIEIVVADNASTDDTPGIVRQCPLPVVYGRQEKTVGLARNMLFATTVLASGEFVWLLGDDDLVLPGGVARVLRSIEDAPDVDYHYLNFGWIDGALRTRVVRELGGHPPVSLLRRLQCRELGWKRLQRLEDMVELPGDNPSALFSGIFCFVTRRQFYIDAVGVLQPTDSLDGSSTAIADCFPHAMLALPRVAGRPVAYIGEPCVMQGVGSWEWGAYAYKNMIFGTYQFFDWLRQTAFAGAAMQRLWSSYYRMAGRLFFRMLHYREEHKGLELVLEQAIPASAAHVAFWDAFMEEARMDQQAYRDAGVLSAMVDQLLGQAPDARVGVWGTFGRWGRFVKLSPQLHSSLVWATARDEALQGARLEGTALPISHTDSLREAALDILVIEAPGDELDEIVALASRELRHGARIVCAKGVIVAGDGD